MNTFLGIIGSLLSYDVFRKKDKLKRGQSGSLTGIFKKSFKRWLSKKKYESEWITNGQELFSLSLPSRQEEQALCKQFVPPFQLTGKLCSFEPNYESFLLPQISC